MIKNCDTLATWNLYLIAYYIAKKQLIRNQRMFMNLMFPALGHIIGSFATFTDSKVVVLMWFSVTCFWCQSFDDVSSYVSSNYFKFGVGC